MAEVVDLPFSELRKLAALWRDEERAFRTVLEVLKDSGRVDLALKVHTFQVVRRKRVFHLLIGRLRVQGEGETPAGGAWAVTRRGRREPRNAPPGDDG